MPGPIKTVCCYAQEDRALLESLIKHLKPFRQNGSISIWADYDITAGTEWKKEIDKQINIAQIVLLLISSNFLASDYCYSVEMKRALERHRQGKARVIPIILRPVYWKDVELLRDLQVLPTNAKPVIDPNYWYHHDAAFQDIAEGIRKVINELKEKQGMADYTDENSGQNSIFANALTNGSPEKSTQMVKGADDFIASLDGLSDTASDLLQQLCAWAFALEQARLAQLYTYHSKEGALTLLPRLKMGDAGLVSVYNDHGTAYIRFWRSVFERRAPRALATIEASIRPITQGSTSHEASEALLALLTEAYRETVQ